MTNAERVAEILKKAGTFYFLSSDGGRPKGRPFSYFDMRDGRIVFGTGTHKKVFRQIEADPRVEILAPMGGKFLRYDGEVEFFEDAEFRARTMEADPFLGKLYNEKSGLKIQFFHLKNGHAEIVSAMSTDEEFDVE